MMGQKYDAICWNHGGITILRPLTDAAIRWCDNNLPEDTLRCCGNSYVIEWRYVDDIVAGMEMAGLTIR
jgi:hypothetical protein